MWGTRTASSSTTASRVITRSAERRSRGLDTELGTLLTVVVQPNHDAGPRNFTLLVPRAFGVTRQQPVTFGTLAIKTTTRGFIATPGVALTYDVLPLVGEAKDVILPL